MDGGLLFHLTKETDTLASILRERRLRAVNAYGALRNNHSLMAAQRVVCLSEIAPGDRERLADRHGEFGLAFRTPWARLNGAAPIWYLSSGTRVQQWFYNLVQETARTSAPRLDHPLWELTPFIDYPGEHDRGGVVTRYEWTWEREWRVRGDLRFTPSDVALLLAPEASHETVKEMWLWEALDSDRGTMPPVIDVRWPLQTQIDVLVSGASTVISDVDGWYDIPDPHVGDEPTVNTAPQHLSWVEDDELRVRELREEISWWFDESERDD